jgi:nitrate/nitrite-specific signal transduction histidine kinase
MDGGAFSAKRRSTLVSSLCRPVAWLVAMMTGVTIGALIVSRRPGHLGLKSMRERTERLGSSLQIESAPGAGTRIRASVPAVPTR